MHGGGESIIMPHSHACILLRQLQLLLPITEIYKWLESGLPRLAWGLSSEALGAALPTLTLGCPPQLQRKQSSGVFFKLSVLKTHIFGKLRTRDQNLSETLWGLRSQETPNPINILLHSGQKPGAPQQPSLETLKSNHAFGAPATGPLLMPPLLSSFWNSLLGSLDQVGSYTLGKLRSRIVRPQCCGHRL